MITIFHKGGISTQGMHYSRFNPNQESSFRIKGTEWQLIIDDEGGLTVLSRYDGCNVGGIGCESDDVKFDSQDLGSLIISEWDCQR